MKRSVLICLALNLTIGVLVSTSQSFACVLQDFQVSTVPSPPEANTDFDLIIDYGGSEGCVLSEELIVSPDGLRFELFCNCPFTVTNPVSQQFQTSVSGLPAGLQTLEAVNLGSTPAPRTVATIQFLIGHAPSIPVSPLALTLLTLTLAVAAVCLLRR